MITSETVNRIVTFKADGLPVLSLYARYAQTNGDPTIALRSTVASLLRELDQVSDQVLRKRDYGGWYGLKEHSVRNKADELVKRHFRRVAGTLGDLFRQGEYELLVIGGHEHEVPRFLEFLPRDLRSRVA